MWLASPLERQAHRPATLRRAVDRLDHFLDLLLGPGRAAVRLAGLCDAAEEGYFRRALERAGLGSRLSRVDTVIIITTAPKIRPAAEHAGDERRSHAADNKAAVHIPIENWKINALHAL